MADTTFTPGTLITSSWSNDVNKLVYKTTLDVAHYGAIGDGVHDDTNAINLAIAALPAAGGKIQLLNKHAISSKLVIRKPVYFLGIAQGASYQPVQAPKTELIWIGGVSTDAMIQFGNSGIGTNVLWGGGIERIHLNGGGVCAYGLKISDSSMGTYREVSCHNVTGAALYLTSDGTKTHMPTAFNSFYKCFFDLRASLVASANAHGILIDATNGTNAGVTLHYFEDLKVNHSNGDGVRWVEGGDGFVFMKPHFFRADAETGYSCNFSSTSSTDICNHCIFYYPIASGGMYFATPGLHQGTYIEGYDSQNINTGLTELISGPGASEVGGYSTFGQKFGISRFGSTMGLSLDDSMSLIYMDNTNNVLFTNNATWRVLSNGGVISASAEVGSGVSLATLATANDSTMISHVRDASNGVSTSFWPSAQIGIKIVSTADCVGRWGFFNSNADPAGDGIWIEYDPTLSSGAYRLVCSRGSTQTVVNNSIGLTYSSHPIVRFRIDVQPGRASFYAAVPSAPNPQLWTFLGTITTNVPITTTALLYGVYIKTKVGTAKSIVVGDAKLTQRINYL